MKCMYCSQLASRALLTSVCHMMQSIFLELFRHGFTCVIDGQTDRKLLKIMQVGKTDSC